MRRIVCLLAAAVLLALGCSPRSAGAAETPPETLLSRDCVFYFRFDGVASHRTAYERTIFAELVNDEFRPLIDEISRLIYDAVGPDALSEQVLKGVSPAELVKLQQAAERLPQLVEHLMSHGFAAGVEVISPTAGRFQVSIVFNGAGRQDHENAALGVFRLFARLADGNVEEKESGPRTVLEVSAGSDVAVRCWKEGPHVILTVGTEDLKGTLELADGKREDLTANSNFQQLARFNKYETWMRGFLDVSAGIELVTKSFPPARPIISSLGAEGLQGVSFHAGFEDRHQRTTTIIHMPGARAGLLKIFDPPTALSLKKLPPLPPDAAFVTAGTADIASLYAEGLQAVRQILAFSGPAGTREFSRELAAFEKSLGFDIGRDLLGSLGSTWVLYSSPTDGGPLLLGLTLAVEVKDADKLRRNLAILVRSLLSATGAEISLQNRQYKGVELNMVQTGLREFPFAPTYVIHDGWLVVSFYPQPPMGFVYRSQGQAATWKPPGLLGRALKESLRPRESGRKAPRLVGVSVADPRPAAQQVLSIAPTIVSFIQNLGPASFDFDLSTIPNSQAVADRLSENVSVTVDDGDALRLEGYASLPVPAQLTGLDIYTVGVFSFIPFALGAF